MIINQENLLQEGYSQFNNSLNKNNEAYLKSYQKKIEDEKGIKYFITIDFYDLNKVNNVLGVQFLSQAQFNLENGLTFNVDGFNNKKLEILELESFYEKIWISMNCKYYEIF